MSMDYVAHHCKGGQAAGQVALGHHLISGDAVQPQGPDGKDHFTPSFLGFCLEKRIIKTINDNK